MNDFLDAERAYVPEVIGTFPAAPFLVIGGMGGSALPALILRFLDASPYVVMHRDYGLPSRMAEGASCIAISYSGNTEETLSFAEVALANGLPLAVIASGGALLAFARDKGLPYVEVPAGPEPRDAILSTAKALLALVGEGPLLADTAFDQAAAEGEGTALAVLLADTVPVFYSSGRNEALSYIAKIQCNETAKVPAFSNVFPELNHNEMQGFESAERAGPLAAVFIRDAGDSERVKRRMDLTESLLSERGVRTARITLPEGSRSQAFLYGWWLARGTARALAERYGVAPDETPLIAAFKAAL
jgi:glucose/mannose-6-phosphate isomerase